MSAISSIARSPLALAHAIQRRGATNEKLSVQWRGRGTEDFASSRRQIVFGHDLQRRSRLNDERPSGLVQKIGQPASGNRRAADLAGQSLFPILVSVGRVITGPNAAQ